MFESHAGIAVLILVGGLGLAAGAVQAATLDLEERVEAQRAIERVLWAHRIWPKSNPGPKPPLERVLSEQVLRSKVEDYLRKSSTLARVWQRPITRKQLQIEIERMARSSRAPEVLEQLFEALNDDAFLIAETLGRQKLADRFLRDSYSRDPRFELSFEAWWDSERNRSSTVVTVEDGEYDLPLITGGPCVTDTWTPTPMEVPDPRLFHTAVWTGSEMIVWGGSDGLSSGGRYDPASDTWTPTPEEAGTPSARYGHTAVWTGSEMIVWGGSTIDNTETNTGGRYDPLSDTWLATSTGANVPSARKWHTAVWTGSEMILWGGWNDFTVTSSGARYDPSSDQWTATSAGATAPEARAYHTAVWTGFEMIVWGGWSLTELLNTGSRYDPASDSWTPTSIGSNVPGSRSHHTAVWTGTEMIVWGGEFLQSGGRYDPVSDTWEATSLGVGVPQGRTDHSAVWTGAEMIVWAGRHTEDLNTGGRYDPMTDTWTPTASGTDTPSARAYHTAVWTGSEMIVWAGSNSEDLITGGRYDPMTDTWTPTASGTDTPSARAYHTAVWTGSVMIVWAGHGLDVAENSGGRYDPSLDSWTPTSEGASVPSRRSYHAAVWTGSEMIVWGGHTASDFAMDSGGVYVPALDAWSPTSEVDAPEGRREPTAVWTGTEMIIWGGQSVGPFPLLTSGAKYDPLSDSWSPTTDGQDAPAGRIRHTAVWTGSEMVVWGGMDFDSEFDTGARYDPSADSWSVVSLTGAPSPRVGHTAVWAENEMIVWGGQDGGQYFDSGARYDPLSDVWTPTSLRTETPSARVYHTAVWTGSEMVVWGGRQLGGNLDTGGRYDPSTDVWEPTSSVGAPMARVHHTAVWSAGRMVIWGGSNPQAGSLFDTGARYDAVTDVWAPTSTEPFVPAPRQRHTAIATGSEMIVWGGDPERASGGRYCLASCSPTTWYRDSDGDGFGSPNVYEFSCSQPDGFIADGTDCDDADEAVWGTPGEARDLRFEDGNTMEWTAPEDPGGVSGSLAYDTIRAGEPFDFIATGFCVETDDSANTVASDPQDPPSDGVYYYLVRPENGCGVGTLGDSSTGPRPPGIPCGLPSP